MALIFFSINCRVDYVTLFILITIVFFCFCSSCCCCCRLFAYLFVYLFAFFCCWFCREFFVGVVACLFDLLVCSFVC